MSPLSIVTLGFLLGLKHATDADHVVAIATIVTQKRNLRHAALVGIIWGIGHTFMVVVVGIAIIAFHVAIPERIQLLFECIVALMLILLGIFNLVGFTRRIFTRFSQTGHTHHHPHPHNLPDVIEHIGMFHLLRPLVVGLIHGLAGSAAIALLILGSISDKRIAVLYLGIFGVGTIAGMMAVTSLLGIPIITGSKTFARFDRIASIAAGAVSIIYGIYIGYRIGFIDGLLMH